MAFANYTELVATVQDHLDRGDLNDAVPGFIELLEARLRRTLRGSVVTVATLTLDAETVALPTDIKELRFVTLPGRGALEPVSLANFADLREVNINPGVPKFFAHVGGNLMLSPAPETSMDATITYEADIVPLATAPGGTNWLLAKYPDIYHYGALVEASPFLRDDSRVAGFDARFQSALAELEILRDRTEYPNTPVARPRRVF